MCSLLSRGSLSPASRSWLASVLGRLTASAALLSLGGVIGCSDDGGSGTSSLADSGSLQAITDSDIEIPTTVTVSQGVVWVVESQFTRFPAFVMDAPAPGPFRLIGYPLAAGEELEYVELPDNFFPEGITTAADGRMYVGSVATGAIYTVGPLDFDAEPFVGAGGLGAASSVFGLTVSRDQSMLWACASDAEGAWLAGIEIASGTQVVKHELEPYSDSIPAFCNDVVQSPNGALWITESMGGRLYRVDPANLMAENSADLWLEAENLAGPEGVPTAGVFGVNGITLVGSRLYLANTARGTLWNIDPSLEEPTNDDLRLVTLSEGGEDNVPLYGPDGIFGLPGRPQLLIVENGFNLGGAGKRVVMATLDAR